MSWQRRDNPRDALSPFQMEENDAELLALARLGDSRAITLLYRRYLPSIYDFTAHRLGSREAAEDATQTIFLKAFTSIGTCRDGTVFGGWLFAIARNVITDTFRSGKVVHLALDDAPDIQDSGPNLEDLALQTEWVRELTALRERCLKEADRIVLDLRLQGLNDKEIATALHRSHGAIRVAQHRMVQKLRDCLGLSRRGEEVTHVEA